MLSSSEPSDGAAFSPARPPSSQAQLRECSCPETPLKSWKCVLWNSRACAVLPRSAHERTWCSACVRRTRAQVTAGWDRGVTGDVDKGQALPRLVLAEPCARGECVLPRARPTGTTHSVQGRGECTPGLLSQCREARLGYSPKR